MKRLFQAGIAAVAVLAIGSTGALAGGAPPNIEFSQDVFPEVIFGSGNTNGGFTTDRRNGIEIGLRAKIPYDGTLHDNGDGTYSYSLAETEVQNSKHCDFSVGAVLKCWNYEWSVNTDLADTTDTPTHVISDFTYELGLDVDPGPGTDFLKFDPIIPTATFWDHSFGFNSTGNGGGVEAGTAADYVTYMQTRNVVQQSWRYLFNPYPPLDMYDPDVPGNYIVYLQAMDSYGKVVARTEIQVLIGGAAALSSPANASECKNGGWANFNPPFASQWDCQKLFKKSRHGGGYPQILTK